MEPRLAWLRLAEEWSTAVIKKPGSPCSLGFLATPARPSRSLFSPSLSRGLLAPVECPHPARCRRRDQGSPWQDPVRLGNPRLGQFVLCRVDARVPGMAGLLGPVLRRVRRRRPARTAVAGITARCRLLRPRQVRFTSAPRVRKRTPRPNRAAQAAHDAPARRTASERA